MNQSKGTILIVDDEKDIRELLGEMLEAEGYAVLLAGSESEALQNVREHDLNLMLLDLRLKREVSDDWSGMKVLEEALRLKPRLQVVIITAFGKIKQAIETTRMGAYDFLEKPIDPERLLLTVKRAIERNVMMGDMEALKNVALEKYEMIGTSQAMLNVYELIEKAAPTKAKVLITGESGVGKELVARAIHHLSPRTAKPFQKVNCAAIPSELIENELFGHEKESFTGALNEKKGKFDMADGGTLFLDEIGDMSLQTQAKVLRVLAEEEFQRVGGSKEIRIDVRIVAATRKDLKQEIDKGNFREDLYYRLNVISIPVPPLRERREDISLLLNHYVHVYCDENNLLLKKFTSDARAFLNGYEWKGNVRELKNLVERLVILTDSETMGRQQVLDALENVPVGKATRQIETLREARMQFEKSFIQSVLEEQAGNISRTAEILGINRVNLYRKMKQFGMER